MFFFKGNRNRRNPIGKTLGSTIKIATTTHDQLYQDALDAVLTSGQASVSMIQRKLKIDFEPARNLMDELETNGIVGAFDGVHPRKILVGQVDTEYDTVNDQNFDCMEGHEFEYFCADLLRKNCFTNVEVTRGSGDQGVDILAIKDDIKYAIQCKCYNSDLGNTPIQEVNTGKTIYHCHIAAVMTNRYFTQGAKEAAEATGVLLWDRDKLISMINSDNYIL